MKPETKAWFRTMQKRYGKYIPQILNTIPEKYNMNLYLEAAQAGAYWGERAAQHQLDTGFLGQSGSFGGGLFTPQDIERELYNLRFSPLI